MAGRLVEERPETKIYTSFNDWKKAYPDFSPIANALIKSAIKTNGSYTQRLMQIEGEYTWGDYTELKFWDSASGFAEVHAKSHPMRSVREHFVADLEKKMAPRFEQGYLIEVLGLRDKNGEDISLAMSNEKCPKSVYHVEMERRAEGRRLLQETSRYLKSLDAVHEATKNSKLVFRISA